MAGVIDSRGQSFYSEFLSEMVEKFRNGGDGYTTVDFIDDTESYA